MTTSRAAVFTGKKQSVELRSLPVPVLAGSEVLVRVLGCTLCGSDIHTFQGHRTVPVPTILGHEIVGRIEEFGPVACRRDLAGSDLRVGDSVTWAIVANCGECFYCRRHLPQKCERAIKYGHEPFQSGHELRGGLAEHCLLADGTSIVRLPKDLPLEVACPASCATATIAAALAAAGDLHDVSVCVIGVGMLGLTACAMSHYRGAREVIAVDVNPQRLARSLEFGATRSASPQELDTTITSATNSRGIDVVLELSGSPDAFELGLRQLRIGGTLILVGAVFPSRPVPLLMEQIVRRHLTLRGVHNYAPEHLEQAVRFLNDQRQIPFASLVAEWMPLADCQRAFERAASSDVVRLGVRP